MLKHSLCSLHTQHFTVVAAPFTVYTIIFIELSQSKESMSDVILSLPQLQERTEDIGQRTDMEDTQTCGWFGEYVST